MQTLSRPLLQIAIGQFVAVMLRKILANTAKASISNGSQRQREITIAVMAKRYETTIAIICFINYDRSSLVKELEG